jgi:hypothetical protein
MKHCRREEGENLAVNGKRNIPRKEMLVDENLHGLT